MHYYPISLEQAPNHLKNAFLASNAIYNFDPLLKYVANKLLRRDPKPIRDRMFKEAFLTLGLKLFMPKDDLFAFYLDCIYLGNNSFGVEAGARIYFAKHVEELTLAEAAALAVLSVGPAEFNPFKNPEILKQKQPYVLKQMLVLSWISEAEYNQAVSQPLVYKSMLNRNK
ncbi:transglycosylase domain-containing protein [Desulfovibrio litoralis]|uniref:transglycosylase domain-containing protein n=1 Tax=Desulfovibrio litoralis TaxID=466107 RepID=UPI0015C05F2C|nr:transglycosylase domain-containing protein [Desulfovibrio litoralis]